MRTRGKHHLHSFFFSKLFFPTCDVRLIECIHTFIYCFQLVDSTIFCHVFSQPYNLALFNPIGPSSHQFPTNPKRSDFFRRWRSFAKSGRPLETRRISLEWPPSCATTPSKGNVETVMVEPVAPTVPRIWPSSCWLVRIKENQLHKSYVNVKQRCIFLKFKQNSSKNKKNVLKTPIWCEFIDLDGQIKYKKCRLQCHVIVMNLLDCIHQKGNGKMHCNSMRLWKRFHWQHSFSKNFGV